MLGALFFHRSCVYRTISRLVLLKLQSARPLNWLKSIGETTDVTQLLQLPEAGVTLGSAYRFRKFCPAGLRRLAGMRLPGERDRPWPDPLARPACIPESAAR